MFKKLTGPYKWAPARISMDRVDAALARLLAEEEGDEPAGEPKPKEPKPKEPKEAAPKPDSEPVVPHWSERRVGELLK